MKITLAAVALAIAIPAAAQAAPAPTPKVEKPCCCCETMDRMACCDEHEKQKDHGGQAEPDTHRGHGGH
jgi:hypothetical protein